jgi:hypothetical protein
MIARLPTEKLSQWIIRDRSICPENTGAWFLPLISADAEGILAPFHAFADSHSHSRINL